MLWRVKLREKIEEDGGVKSKKSKKSKGDKGRGNGVAEGGDGEEAGATSSRGGMMKERVKKRRAVAKAQQSRSMPKVQVDENLQTSAIEVRNAHICISSVTHYSPLPPFSCPIHDRPASRLILWLSKAVSCCQCVFVRAYMFAHACIHVPHNPRFDRPL
jgi:hypothetical protein